MTVYQNSTTEKEQRKVSGVEDRTKLTTRGINLRNHSELPWFSLVYGVDYMQDKADTERGTNNSDARYRSNPYQAKSNTTGAYLIAHIPLWGEKLLFSPSVRYDRFNTSSEAVKYQDSHWSPAAKLTWKATTWLDFTAKYNEAFRAPSMQSVLQAVRTLVLKDRAVHRLSIFLYKTRIYVLKLRKIKRSLPMCILMI